MMRPRQRALLLKATKRQAANLQSPLRIELPVQGQEGNGRNVWHNGRKPEFVSGTVSSKRKTAFDTEEKSDLDSKDSVESFDIAGGHWSLTLVGGYVEQAVAYVRR